MSKTAQIQTRVEPSLKVEAEDILAQLGLSSTDYVRMALKQLVMRRGIPFDASIPNPETQTAMVEHAADKASGKAKGFESTADLLTELDSDTPVN